MLRIGITCGDINGIGPEIIAKSIKYFTNVHFNLIGPKNVLLNYLSKAKFDNFENITFTDLGRYSQNIGTPTLTSGKVSLEAIETSFQLWKENKIDLIVTAPISKTAIAKVQSRFIGHTEMYASFCGIEDYVMMFLSNKFNCALITIHISISKVCEAITRKNLESKLSIIKNTLIEDLSVSNAKIAVLGLNPHAGEDKLIGKEEEKVISPTIEKMNSVRKCFFGPISSDGYFGAKEYKKYSCTVGMYHDQVLIPFKLLNFNDGVNYTAGLPLIRTSPDHGTAFNLAGKNLANPRSMISAIRYGIKIYKNKQK